MYNNWGEKSFRLLKCVSKNDGNYNMFDKVVSCFEYSIVIT